MDTLLTRRPQRGAAARRSPAPRGTHTPAGAHRISSLSLCFLYVIAFVRLCETLPNFFVPVATSWRMKFLPRAGGRGFTDASSARYTSPSLNLLSFTTLVLSQGGKEFRRLATHHVITSTSLSRLSSCRKTTKLRNVV